MAAKPTVVIGMPRRDCNLSFGAAEGFYLWPTGGDCEIMARIHTQSSLLCRAFNTIWAQARNLEPDYFAMIHADVAPEPKWLDILLAELLRLEADVVSTVIPIKTQHGITSTAVLGDDRWHSRRLAMTEVCDLPETFGEQDVGGPLLLNSGLWICDFRKRWCREVHFEMEDRITRDQEGQWGPECISEDWLFSMKLHELGCKLFATRKVKVNHAGESHFGNDRPWGTCKTDDAWHERQAKAIAEVVHA
jgi:cellulose synthase/poly-beta-1,6-N-acetylglucosamine synthase-like glycosyltransferase